MSIQAKVVSTGQSVTSSPAVQLDGQLALEQGSKIALQVPRDAVAEYSREGSDLIVHLKNGETLRIANFYATGQAPSELFVVEEGHLVAVDLSAASGGELSASYAPQASLAGFESLTSSSGIGGMSTTTTILAGAGIIAGGAAIAGGGGGGGGGGSKPDTTPPAAASELAISSDGSRLSGRAEAGATVGIDLNGDGTADISVVADASGSFQVALNPPLINGETVSVVVTDAAGNRSPAASVQAPDFPDAPQVDASNGQSLSGSAAAGMAILISDGNGTLLGKTTADGNGHWAFTPNSPLAHGTLVYVTAADAFGNQGPSASTIVDALPPAAPTLALSNGLELHGTAEAGARISLIDGSGNLIGQTVADAQGNWSFTPALRLSDGLIVKASATDALGNVSGQTSTTVDAVAPDTPILQLSNGRSISGLAEPDSTVILTDLAGNSIGVVEVDGTGQWRYVPDSVIANNTVVMVVARDAAGNVSAPASVTVDSVAPAAPVIHPSDGVSIFGTAEPGSAVVIYNSANQPIARVVADSLGNWSFVPGSKLPNDEVVHVTATDAAGNTSQQSTLVIDGIPPAAPIVDPSNGVWISGTGEPGARIILIDGRGSPLGQTLVDDTGQWQFTFSFPLNDGTVVRASAADAAGNYSGVMTIIVDAVAPPAPTVDSSNGIALSGSAEAGSNVVLTDGQGNPIGQANVDSGGSWSFVPTGRLPNGTVVNAVAVDASGNRSLAVSITIDSVAPAAPVINPSNGTLIAGTAEPGATIILNYVNGGLFGASSVDSYGNWQFVPSTPWPNGTQIRAFTLDAAGNTGASAQITIDSVAPAQPSVNPSNGREISGTSEPGSLLLITDGNGKPIGQTVADNTGNWHFVPTSPLPNGSEIDVVAQDAAGNTSVLAVANVDASLMPLTIADFVADVSLNPLAPRYMLSGNSEAHSVVTIRVIGPGVDQVLTSIVSDGNGHFTLDMLDPAVLSQLGKSTGDIISLGAQISYSLVASDSSGNQSPSYHIVQSPNGSSVDVAQIEVNGTANHDVLLGVTSSTEYFYGGDGDDLIHNVGAGDHVLAGNGNDTIQITSVNFAAIDGGAGFDTLMLANGIDLDYSSAGVGTLNSIERIDLGKGDSGSTLTLTANDVNAITDGNDVLQITGESNDTLNVAGAVNTGTTQQIDGVTYNIYSFGSSTLLVEDHTVQVVA